MGSKFKKKNKIKIKHKKYKIKVIRVLRVKKFLNVIIGL